MKDPKELGDRTWVVVLGIVGSMVAIFVFLTGRNLPDLVSEPGASTPSYSEPPANSTGDADHQSVLDAPEVIAPTSRGDTWSGQLSVRKPTLNEIREEDPASLWDANLIDVRDMHEPGLDSYSGKARFGAEYLFPVYWCSTSSELLVENMDRIETTIMVNAEVVPDKYVFVFDFETDSGWVCRYHAVVLGEWTRNVQYTLDISRVFSEELFDGESAYSPGEYDYRLILTIE